MDKLQWFKFSPSDWMMGKIIRCSEITQARFLRLCCLYWNKETNLSKEDAIIEIDQEHFNVLLSKKIVTVEDSKIIIEFLDLQFDKALEKSKKASLAGKASAEKRKTKAEQEFNKRSTNVQQIRKDKIRKDKDKNINIPTLEEFVKYALEKKPNVNRQDLKLKYEAWKENDWKDGNDKRIKNWKTKICHTMSYMKEVESQKQEGASWL